MPVKTGIINFERVRQMKKIAVSALAVLMACPAFAGINHPDQGSSWQMWGMDPYVGLRGGLSYTNLNYKYDGNKDDKQVKKGITLTDFDETILSVDGDEITPKTKGETYVTAHWQDFSVTFLVKIV